MGVISNILKFVGLTPAGPSGSWHIPVNTIKMITVDEELQKVYVYIDGEGQDLVNHDYIEITAPNKYVAKIADSLSMIITNFHTHQNSPVIVSNKNVKRSSSFAYITKLEYISVGPNPEIELCCNTDDHLYCTIPDPVFRYGIEEQYGPQEWINGNQILKSTINVITSLDFSELLGVPLYLTDMTGIECFTALEYLNIADHNLTTIDLSQNTALIDLYCQTGDALGLDSLNVSQCVNLVNLWCNSNNLTSLDVSQNTALEVLRVDLNQLTSLNVSGANALIHLSCIGNQLTSLDVSQNTALVSLNIASNQLTSLDVDSNTALGWLYCESNPLGINGGILDVSLNTALIELHCFSNQLTSLDVSQNTALTYLNCYNNQLTSLDIQYNTALDYLNCGNNQLTTLDVQYNILLNKLYCQYNQLTGLDISQTVIQRLDCSNNQLTGLDVHHVVGTVALPNFPFLTTYLDCSSNDLATLNIANGVIAYCLNATLGQAPGGYFNALGNPNVVITIDQANIGNYASGTCVDSTATFIAV